MLLINSFFLLVLFLIYIFGFEQNVPSYCESFIEEAVLEEFVESDGDEADIKLSFRAEEPFSGDFCCCWGWWWLWWLCWWWWWRFETSIVYIPEVLGALMLTVVARVSSVFGIRFGSMVDTNFFLKAIYLSLSCCFLTGADSQKLFLINLSKRKKCAL